MTLKELANKYSDEQIIDEMGKTYALNYEDYIAFSDLLKAIRISPAIKDTEKAIDFYVLLVKGRKEPLVIPYASFLKNGRMNKLTYKNTADILSVAGCEVNIHKEFESHSEMTARTELQQLIAVLLSFTAFSDEVVDYLFDGDISAVKPEKYLKYLYDNKED